MGLGIVILDLSSQQAEVVIFLNPQPSGYLEVKYVIMVPSEGEPTIYNHHLEDPANPDDTSVCRTYAL
jgi:hypothetical protein